MNYLGRVGAGFEKKPGMLRWRGNRVLAGTQSGGTFYLLRNIIIHSIVSKDLA